MHHAVHLMKETLDDARIVVYRHNNPVNIRIQYTRQETPMGWLRLVVSLKLHISFVEHSLFYRALLQKNPIILRSLLIVATP